MKRKAPMPSYYGKNIAQNAQRKFLARRAAEREKRDRAARDALDPDRGEREKDRVSGG